MATKKKPSKKASKKKVAKKPTYAQLVKLVQSLTSSVTILLEEKRYISELQAENKKLKAKIKKLEGKPNPSKTAKTHRPLTGEERESIRLHGLWLPNHSNGVRADFSNHDFSGADLLRADLRNAILFRVDLRGANLEGANLFRVDLREADLSGARLEGANLWGATFNSKTILPKGWTKENMIVRGAVYVED